jgi:RHS repeat-associated protein
MRALRHALARQIGSSVPQLARRMLGLAVRAVATLLVLLAFSAPTHAQEVIEYYGTDHLGSVRVVFDAAGNALARADYLPYGEEVSAPTGQMPAQQFTGQARDGEAGQDYFHARMYAPRAGRFNAVDPLYVRLSDPQQLNRYSYARNNPHSYRDPTGMYNQPRTNCSQNSGAYWCPGDSLFIPPPTYVPSDDPYDWGYHGGENQAALDAWGGQVDSNFLIGAIFGTAAGLDTNRRTVGQCDKPRCGQITNDYKDGLAKTEGGNHQYELFLEGDIALNTDGALFGNNLLKVATGVHITMNKDGSWDYDSKPDWLLDISIGNLPGQERTGWYNAQQWVSPTATGGFGHPDWIPAGMLMPRVLP